MRITAATLRSRRAPVDGQWSISTPNGRSRLRVDRCRQVRRRCRWRRSAQRSASFRPGSMARRSAARGPTLREAPAAGTDPHSAAQQTPPRERLSWKNYLGVFKYSRRAIRLVWATNRALAIGMALGSLVAGALPSAIAVVGKHLLNAILATARAHTVGAVTEQALRNTAAGWLGKELALVVGLATIRRLLGTIGRPLRPQIG